MAGLLLGGGAAAGAASPLSGFNPAVLAGAPGGPSARAAAFAAADPVPLRSFLTGDWEGSFSARDTNHADLYWQADAGAVWRSWRVAGLYRGELFLQANRDTVELLHLVKRKDDLPVGRTFRLDLEGRGFSAVGAEVSRGFSVERLVPGLRLGTTARWLSGERLQQGVVSGNAVATGSNSYEFEATVDYAYDHNFLYKRDNSSPEGGEGFSFDAGFVYEWRRAVRVAVLLRDLFGRIYWNRAPYTSAQATSEVKSYDENGYQEYRPTIRGFEGYKDVTQHIPRKTDVDVAYLGKPLGVSATVNFIEARPLYWLGADVRVTESLGAGLAYNLNYGAATVSCACGLFEVAVTMDRADLNDAKALGVSLAYGRAW